jgi:hypothetical protein
MARGSITARLKDNFVIDAGVRLLLDPYDPEESFKVGDWVETRLYQIYFVSRQT